VRPPLGEIVMDAMLVSAGLLAGRRYTPAQTAVRDSHTYEECWTTSDSKKAVQRRQLINKPVISRLSQLRMIILVGCCLREFGINFFQEKSHTS